MDYGMLHWKGSNHLKAREKNQPAYVSNIGRETENYGHTCISKEQFCSMQELVPRIRSLWHFEGVGWREQERKKGYFRTTYSLLPWTEHPLVVRAC